MDGVRDVDVVFTVLLLLFSRFFSASKLASTGNDRKAYYIAFTHTLYNHLSSGLHDKVHTYSNDIKTKKTAMWYLNIIIKSKNIIPDYLYVVRVTFK